MNQARTFCGMSLTMLCLLLLSAVAPAQAADLEQQVRQRAMDVEEKLIAWRRDIHQHLALGDQETRTAKLVTEHLRGRRAHDGLAGSKLSGG